MLFGWMFHWPFHGHFRVIFAWKHPLKEIWAHLKRPLFHQLFFFEWQWPFRKSLNLAKWVMTVLKLLFSCICMIMCSYVLAEKINMNNSKVINCLLLFRLFQHLQTLKQKMLIGPEGNDFVKQKNRNELIRMRMNAYICTKSIVFGTGTRCP